MEQTTYQITQAAALACSHLPLPPGGFELPAFLEKWQDLSGAVIGGLMGVVGALVVAGNSVRREQRIGARLILVDLAILEASNQRFAPLRNNEQALCERLIAELPDVSSLDGPLIGQITDVSERLAAHLHLCQTQFRAFKKELDKFAALQNSVERRGAHAFQIMRTSVRVKELWDLVCEHATLSAYYIDRFLFRKWPRWAFRLCMTITPNDFDQRSRHVLKKGKILKPPKKGADEGARQRP
ncbi:hypothetical protein QCE73_00090 [Caballeronia sp. LZ029]|uniref:hypothetical protein n=1 Tax=Caballeronia sp. LZ029 TaxID=3038564 RepID=UPI00285E2880|nr:hypothetical protein [Caballeronia sp. LZ029]MDR5741547.1 hypothetical protein [Caballeronia sp. LZ029]